MNFLGQKTVAKLPRVTGIQYIVGGSLFQHFLFVPTITNWSANHPTVWQKDVKNTFLKLKISKPYIWMHLRSSYFIAETSLPRYLRF